MVRHKQIYNSACTYNKFEKKKVVKQTLDCFLNFMKLNGLFNQSNLNYSVCSYTQCLFISSPNILG